MIAGEAEQDEGSEAQKDTVGLCMCETERDEGSEIAIRLMDIYACTERGA